MPFIPKATVISIKFLLYNGTQERETPGETSERCTLAKSPNGLCPLSATPNHPR